MQGMMHDGRSASIYVHVNTVPEVLRGVLYPEAHTNRIQKKKKDR